MAQRATILRTVLLSVLCAAPAYAVPSGLGILSQNYGASTFEFYEALVVSGGSSLTFGPTADPVIQFTQSTMPPVEILHHALWPNEGSDVLFQAQAGFLSGRVAATGLVFSQPQWTDVSLAAQLEARGQVTFRPLEDSQVIWAWRYAQKEGPLPLSARWSFTDVTTGEERVLANDGSNPPVGQMTLRLLAADQYSLDWFLVAGNMNPEDLVAFPGDPRMVDVFADLHMSLVIVPVPGAVMLAVAGAGLMSLWRRLRAP